MHLLKRAHSTDLLADRSKTWVWFFKFLVKIFSFGAC